LCWTVDGPHVFRADEPMGDGMKRITVMGAGLALLVGVVATDAQVGYGPGVNPSNPQDLRGRSNPQDLSAPGGSNRQDLVRRPPGAISVVTSPPRTTTPRYTKKAKAKPKPRRSTAPR
jgi:hypothetical protein